VLALEDPLQGIRRLVYFAAGDMQATVCERRASRTGYGLRAVLRVGIRIVVVERRKGLAQAGWHPMGQGGAKPPEGTGGGVERIPSFRPSIRLSMGTSELLLAMCTHD